MHVEDRAELPDVVPSTKNAYGQASEPFRRIFPPLAEPKTGNYRIDKILQSKPKRQEDVGRQKCCCRRMAK